MILPNAAAKRDFYLIRHFGVKMSPATGHTQRQDVLDVKIVGQAAVQCQVGRVKLSCFEYKH